MPDRIVITGGLGFIGSALLRRMVKLYAPVVNIDAHTYAGDSARLSPKEQACTETVRMDVADPLISDVVARARPDLIVHAAAETHVTRSEADPASFFRSNVVGTRCLLEAAERADVGLFVHISTDEVYGPCRSRPFAEGDKLAGEGLATSAYARSKALADDLARSFADRVPVIVVRPANCFGPWQHPEKAIARWVTRALRREPIPVWGQGRQVRDWMYVDDACDGIETIIERGAAGEVYNLAPEGAPRTNHQMAATIARLAGRGEESVRLTAYDRPQHDIRYAIDASRVRSLGWSPSKALDERLQETIHWYRDHRRWWASLVEEAESLYPDSLESAGR